MQLNPLEQFTIVRQLDWAADPNTYYVQAVIYNVQNNAVIAKVNLTGLGSQKFSQAWQVLGNPGMMGFYISIVTTVYTDSGYTQVSPTYSTDEHTYLIQQRYVPALGPNGGGIEFDYKMIRKLIQEELGFLKKKSPAIQTLNEFDVERVMNNVLGSMFDRVGSPLKSLQDGYSRNEKFIGDMKKSQSEREQALLAGFEGILTEFMGRMGQESTAHHQRVATTVDRLAANISGMMSKSGADNSKSFVENGESLKKMLTEHFNSLIEGENSAREKKIKSFMEKSIRAALEQVEFSPDAIGKVGGTKKSESLIPESMRKFIGAQ